MGFRNPFRLQVDENDVAYVTDYSPDSQTPQRQPRAARRRPLWRSSAIRPTTAGRTATRPSSPYYRWNFRSSRPARTTAGVPADDPPQPYRLRQPERAVNDVALDARRRPGRRARPRDDAAADRAGHLVLVQRQQRDARRSVRRASPTTRRPPGPIAPGSTTECPRLFPELYTGGVGPHGARQVPLRPDEPEPDEVPAVLRQLDLPRRVHPGHAARDQARLAEPHLQDQQLPATAAQANIPNPAFAFECDNPMDMQFGARTASFYLLTYGDGFFTTNPDAGLYRWDYVKGQRAPKAVLEHRQDRRRAAADGQLHERRAPCDADPGDSIRYEWDFGDGSPLSTEAEPDARLHQGRPLHGDPDGHRLLRQADRDQHDHHRGQHERRRWSSTAPLDGGLFAFGDTIQYKVTVTDPEDPSINCNDVQVTFVLGHDTHGHARAEHQRLHRVPARPIAGDVTHGGNVFGVISASYTDKGGSRRPGAAADARPRRSRCARSTRRSSSSSTSPARTTATNTDTTAHGRAPRQPRRRRLAAAQRPVQPVPDRQRSRSAYADARQRPHRRLAAGGDRDPPGLDHRADRGHRRT